MISELDIMDKGMACLIRELGVVEAEYFISNVKRDRFDYTKWRRNQFEDMTLEEINSAAADYAVKHPFTGKAKII
ncbi:MAG: hypothetical protein IJ794_00380 [Lachnospiraceae bacterium]|nr:hypothetical protein [Lachnospiraceae bacterium]